jgi:uncharacterized protein
MNRRIRLDGCVALVTGASSGIGREIAVTLAQRVSKLVLTARRADRLEQLRSDLTARHPALTVIALPCDLSNEDEVARLPERVGAEAGSVDVLVNAAGVGEAALFDRSDWDRVRRLLQTNVMAVVQLTQAFVPDMVARRRGGVLNIGSGAGFAIMPNAAVYVGSKHFVDGFSEALRADLAGTGVVVTQVCPGPVATEFDEVAGSIGGMAGAPPQFVRIGATQCAREALAGFERGDPLVFPGQAFRFIMRVLLPLAPRIVRRRVADRGARRIRAANA